MIYTKFLWGLMGVFLGVIFFLGPALAQSDLKEKLAKQASIIDPGSSVTCDNDFIVENIAGKPAHFKVVLGNEDYINEKLEVGEKRAFSLKGSIFLAQSHGRNVARDDLAMIINVNPDSKLRMRCFGLKKNPLREKDDLTIFR